MSLYFYLIVLFISFVLSLVLTPLMRKFALATGQVATPKDSRWHRKETALLGGISIFIAMMTTWAFAVVYTDWSIFGKPYLPMMLCACAMFGLGLADDFFVMDPQHKLAAQIVITAVLLFFGFRLEWTGSGTINLFLSFLWIVGITNAFNLLDNMDGLATGIAIIAGGFLFLILYLNPNPTIIAGPILIVSMAYLGSLLGFLVFNFNPASIFMGDAGSLFIGFVLACLTMIGSPVQVEGRIFVHLLSVIAIPVFILFIPILDTGFVSLMRKLFRRAISQGGQDHSSHRMVAFGFSERKAVLILYGFSVVSGIIALAINRLSIGISIVIIVLYLLFMVFFWIYLAKVKVYPEESIISERKSGGLTPILIDITYRRRLFEVLLDFVLVAVSYYGAYLLRFEGDLGANLGFFLKSLPIMIACQVLCFYILGVYRGVWGSTSLRDLSGYFKAITAGTITAILVLLFLYRFQSFSRAVFVIYWFLMVILVSLSRFSFRLLDEGIRKANRKGKPTLIYGAGLGGQMAVKEVETNQGLGLAVVGFIDDNTWLYRRKVQGYPVFGGQKEMGKVIKRHHIQVIVISFKESGLEKKEEIKDLCRAMGNGVEVRQMRLIIS
ncbi:MAG: hypothetical protein GY864_09400 [Desulfobacterales bacterium]|nr:hypothetical protein [Desulfobacterales bacterium]